MAKKEILVQNVCDWLRNTLPPYPTSQPEITVMKITLTPGEKLAMHTQPVNNAGVILNGQLRVTDIDGNSRIFNSGDAIIEMVNKLHYGENPGSTPTELIMFYASSPGILLSE